MMMRFQKPAKEETWEDVLFVKEMDEDIFYQTATNGNGYLIKEGAVYSIQNGETKPLCGQLLVREGAVRYEYTVEHRLARLKQMEKQT
jgi:hypothetical protein